MSRLGVQLGVDDFETYRAKMLDAQKIAIDTQRVINGMQNPTFGNAVQISSSFKQMPVEAKRASTEVDVIMRQTAANKRAQDLIMAASSRTLADAQIRDAKRTADGLAPHIARARADQAQLARTSDALALLQGRNSGANGPLTGEQRYGRVNLARQGADVFTQIGSGQGVGITAIQQGPQIVEAMAMSGLKLSSSIAATAVAVGGIAAAGYAVVKWSESVRSEAERRLKVEEMIAAAGNKQVLQSKELLANYRQTQANAARARSFNDYLNNSSVEELRNGFELRERMIGFSPETTGLSQQETASITERIRALQAGSTANADAAFSANWENWKKRQAAEVERAQRFAEDVKKGQEMVKNVGQTWRSTFTDLERQANSENPFVKVFFDAGAEMDKLRERLRGLPAEMQAAAIASQQTFNARQLFGARLDNTMSVFDLRELAASYRDDSAQRRAFAQGGLDRQIAGDSQRIAMGGVNTQAILEYQQFRQKFIDRQFQGETPADKLDRQIAALDRINPQNSGEQALLDQRILRTASGIDPASINSGTRERLAQIADRAADREENRFQEALAVQKQMAASLKKISGEEQKLSGDVAKNGSGVIDIRIKNEAEGVAAEARPTQDDVSRTFRQL